MNETPQYQVNLFSRENKGMLLYKSIFYYNEIPEAGYFRKKRGLFNSQFQRPKVQIAYIGFGEHPPPCLILGQMASWRELV
jgi:hypothetical protein